MRHKISGKHFGRDKDERKHLFRNLVSELIVHGRVKTTVTKAKAVRPIIDKLVTKAKKATLGGKRDIFGIFPKEIASIFFDSVLPRFATRVSGFSRIIHLGPRSGDTASIVILEWTQQAGAIVPVGEKSDKKTVTAKGTKKINEVKSSKSVVAKKQIRRVVAKK